MNYRLRYKNIAYKVGEFTRWWKILGELCRRQEEKLGRWEILDGCCLRRMRCGRIFGHMRFEALKSRSFPIVDAYSSWTRIHLSRRRRRYIIFFVLLERKLSTSRVVQNRQISIKIHSKPFKIDKNPL